MNRDETYMRMALRLAAKGEGLTSPNPMVGAVIVRNGRIIGRGYHKRYGLQHAEVNALKDAGKRSLKGATMYVTLEPCDHFGKTPPCTASIIESGIKKVIIAMKDPNPVNNGRGIAKLKKHGIRTVPGILEKEARALNKPYVKFITRSMPYVTVKVAESIDGKIATRTGDSKWITSEDARLFVHRLRAKVDAVMVGGNTILKDDSLLASKTTRGKQPVRVVVCGKKDIPRRARIFSKAGISPVIIAKSKTGRVDLKELMRVLAGLKIANILVEGGGELVASLVRERLVDRFLFFISPKIIGGRDAITSVEGEGVAKVGHAVTLKNMKLRRFKRDLLIETEVA